MAKAEQHIENLRKIKYTNSKTVSSSDDISSERKAINYYTVEKIEKLDAYERYKLQQKAYRNDELFAVQKNPTELDYKLLDVIFGDKITPLFFSTAKSTSLYVKKPKNFFKMRQFSNNYFMPVTLKDFDTRKITVRTKKKENEQTGEIDELNVAFCYVATDRSNVNGVLDVVVDIDFHNEENRLEFEELERFAHAVNFFTTEAEVQPTGIVVTGNGIQLHYVLKEPVYRNSPNIDKLLKTFYKKLKEVLNKEVLPNIELSKNTTCDDSLNPINQKVRVPGTFNFSSLTYAHAVIVNENSLYHMGEFLSSKLGDYEEFRNTIKEILRKKEEKVDKRRGNNGNGRGNILEVLKRRITDIEHAMVYASETVGTGFRNNGFLTLAWQYINLSDYKKKMTDSYIARELRRVDRSLEKPYFKNRGQVESFVDSVRETMNKSDGRHFRNASIEDYCTALQIAEDNIEMEIFFKETVEAKRNKRRDANKEERNRKVSKIKQAILNNNFNIAKIAKSLNIARNTVYKIINELCDEANVKANNVREALKGLRKALIRLIIANKANPVSFQSRYLLFSTEKLNTTSKSSFEKVKKRFKSIKNKLKLKKIKSKYQPQAL